MYFSARVKEKKEDFFNFEVLQENLKEAVKNKEIPLIAIHGLRRTGKTSLIKVVLNTIKKKHIWIDGRVIASKSHFNDILVGEIEKFKTFKIEKIGIKGVEFGLGKIKRGLDYLNKKKMSLVLDEAQLLKKFGLDAVLASIYDNYSNIKIIVSGSETGILSSFLGTNNAKAPLYGRAVHEIQTTRLDREGSSMFLKLGAKQAKITISEDDINKTIEKLDGIIGWLTKYGWYRQKKPHRDALAMTIDEGKQIVLDEFMRISAGSEKYSLIVKSVKNRNRSEGARWEELKEKTSISDKQLYTMTKRLIDSGFLLKQNELYTIADPMLEEAI